MKKLSSLSLLMLGLLVLPLAALAAERDTPERDGRMIALEAGEAILAGHMVAVGTIDGKAYHASDANPLLAVVGRADNSAAEGAGVVVRRGVFRWDNAGAFTAADIGQSAYVLGSTSVTKANIATNDIPAGVIQAVDSVGVWVDTYNPTLQLTSTVAALAVNGNTTVGGTLGVTGAATFTAAPTLTATGTPASVTLTMATAPTTATAGKDTPAYIVVKIGAVSHVIPAWPLSE